MYYQTALPNGTSNVVRIFRINNTKKCHARKVIRVLYEKWA